MFNLFQKSVAVSGLGILKDYTDWHSHILPGVDDGVRTLDESLQILAEYEKLGVSNVWLTPHIMEDIPNTTEDLRRRFNDLKAAYNGPIVLKLSAENMIDVLFDERLSNNDFLPFDGNMLLVETSYFNPPMDLYSKLEAVKAAGYYPVLAHPERYIYMGKSEYEKLKRMGVLFQLNLFSMTGGYGKVARAKAEDLLEKGYYNFSGSDMHRISSLHNFLEGNLHKKAVQNLKVLLDR